MGETKQSKATAGAMRAAREIQHAQQIYDRASFPLAKSETAEIIDREAVAPLRSALERTLNNFKLLLAQKPVRDASETIAEAEAALLKARG